MSTPNACVAETLHIGVSTMPKDEDDVFELLHSSSL